MGEKINTIGDKQSQACLNDRVSATANYVLNVYRYIYGAAHKKMECHGLQTFHSHYKACV